MNTKEQDNCLALAVTGESLMINAYAGCGKSTQLRLIAEAMPHKRMLYIAFNKSVATEAASKFPDNVECRTAHSVAYAAIGYRYAHRLQGKLQQSDVTELLGLPSTKHLSLLVMRAMEAFIKSANSEFTINMIDEVLLKQVLRDADDERIAKARCYVLGQAAKLFNLLATEDCPLPVTHDFYLKLFAMSKPQLGYDVILCDESQDLSKVVISILSCQRNTQIIAVGDYYQTIYGWNGAVGIDTVMNFTNVAYLTTSFRFGDNIAQLANCILDADKPLIGFKANDTVYFTDSNQEPDAIACRSNVGVIAEAVRFIDRDKPCYVLGGTKDLTYLLSGIMDLIFKGSTKHPDLMTFDSWDDVVTMSQDDHGAHLRPLVAIARRYHGRLPWLAKCLRELPQTYAKGLTTIGTTHKLKGLEYDHVKLSGDFKDYITDDGLIVEERNILYVAVTRGIKSVDVSALEWLNRFRF